MNKTFTILGITILLIIFINLPCWAEPCEADFNCDSGVDGSDLAVFAADFGRTDCDSNISKVIGRADGQWRTATFTLSQPPERGHLDFDADFYLSVVSGGDLTVRFVRVIRSN